MTTVSAKTERTRERNGTLHIVNSLSLASELQDLTHVPALMKASVECSLAAFRISRLTRRTVDILLHLAESGTCIKQ